MTAEQASSVVDAAAAAVVIVGVWLAAIRSIGQMTWLLAAQSLLMALATLAVAESRGSMELLLGALLTVAIRAVALPLVIRRLLRASPVRHEREPYLGRRASAAVAVAIVFVAAIAVGGVASLPGGTSARALPAAMAEVLTGLLVVVTRRKSLSMVVGLLVFENGISLAALALTAGMPLVVELGATFDVLIVLVVVRVHSRRMLSTMGTLSTDRLRSLRG